MSTIEGFHCSSPFNELRLTIRDSRMAYMYGSYPMSIIIAKMSALDEALRVGFGMKHLNPHLLLFC